MRGWVGRAVRLLRGNRDTNGSESRAVGDAHAARVDAATRLSAAKAEQWQVDRTIETNQRLRGDGFGAEIERSFRRRRIGPQDGGGVIKPRGVT